MAKIKYKNCKRNYWLEDKLRVMALRTLQGRYIIFRPERPEDLPQGRKDQYAAFIRQDYSLLVCG